MSSQPAPRLNDKEARELLEKISKLCLVGHAILNEPEDPAVVEAKKVVREESEKIIEETKLLMEEAGIDASQVDAFRKATPYIKSSIATMTSFSEDVAALVVQHDKLTATKDECEDALKKLRLKSSRHPGQEEALEKKLAVAENALAAVQKNIDELGLTIEAWQVEDRNTMEKLIGKKHDSDRARGKKHEGASLENLCDMVEAAGEETMPFGTKK